MEAAIAWVFENREQGDILDAGAAGEFQEYKMVFVINSSLSMTPGKMAAQVGHGAIALYQDLVARQDIYGGALLQWSECGYETSIEIDFSNFLVENQFIKVLFYFFADRGKSFSNVTTSQNLSNYR